MLLKVLKILENTENFLLQFALRYLWTLPHRHVLWDKQKLLFARLQLSDELGKAVLLEMFRPVPQGWQAFAWLKLGSAFEIA